MFLGNCKPILGEANVFIGIDLVSRLSDGTWIGLSEPAANSDR